MLSLSPSAVELPRLECNDNYAGTINVSTLPLVCEKSKQSCSVTQWNFYCPEHRFVTESVPFNPILFEGGLICELLDNRKGNDPRL